MKLSQKIFIISYLLIIFSMYLLGYLMINHNFNNSMEKEVSSHISSHKVLRKILLEYLNMKEVTKTSYTVESMESLEDKNKTISGLVEEFNKNDSNNKYVQVCKNTSIIYSNILNKTSELNQLVDDNITTYITQMEQDTVLFVISQIKIEETSYEIVTGNTITSIYDSRSSEITFFTKVGIGLSIGVSILLFLFVYLITRRINQLSKAVSEVANGSYHIQVKAKGKDEISMLTSGFNKMTEAIHHHLEEVNQLSEARKEFIADLTHEIKTPLTSIIGYADLLKKVKITDQNMILEYSDRIYQEGQYMKALSEKLMDIVLLDNKQFVFSSIHLSKVIKEACISAKTLIHDTIEFEYQICPNVFVKGDSDLIKSVILNLVKNSSLACPSENGNIKVILDHSSIQIIDNGKGISEKELDKILEPFYTLDKSRNRNKNGLGLGLYLSKKIMDIHHFKMEIVSYENQGTKITIYFKEEMP